MKNDLLLLVFSILAFLPLANFFHLRVENCSDFIGLASIMPLMNASGPDYCSDEFGIHDLAAELDLEICSYLEVHDQLAMRRVCKRWRSNIPEALLSRYVDVDTSKIPDQPDKPEQPEDLYPLMYSSQYGCWTSTGYVPVEVFQRDQAQQNAVRRNYDTFLTVIDSRLQRALNQHLHKNTKVLVIRNMTFEHNQFGVLTKIIQENVSDLLQLVLKDCTEQEEGSAYWEVEGRYRTMRDLMSTTRQLLLDNHTMRNVLDRAVCCYEMPCSIGQRERLRGGNMMRKVPVVLPRHEFDCSQPLHQLYPAFIVALNSNCPEVSPDVRSDVMQLCHSWKLSGAHPNAWQWLGFFIKSLNEGVYDCSSDAEESAGRQVDPRTLNKLTTEALHRMYCLPGQRYSASTNADNVPPHVADVG